MTTAYDYWRAKLANPRDRIPVDQNAPQPGFYRTKDGVPVAIWVDDDGLNMMAGGDAIVPVQHHESMWTRCADRPVSEEHYHSQLITGRWHDVDEDVAAIGQNRMSSDLEGLIDDLAAAAAKYNEIDDDAVAASAQSLRDKLLGLKGRADKQRVEEKQPHLDAGRRVDERWMPWVKKAQGAADMIRMAISAHETRKREAARRAADEAARAAAAGQPAPQEEVVPAPLSQVRGGQGRAASVREAVVVDQIQDWIVLATHYASRPSVQEAILRCVAHDLKDGHEVPGITTKRVANIR